MALKRRWKLITAGAAVVSGIAYVGNYLWNAVHKPEVYYKPTKFNTSFLERVNILNEKYWPTFWAHNQHFSTIVPTLFRSNPRLQFRRETIIMPDTGVVGLDWFELPEDNKHTPTLVFLPGLNGSSNAEYIQHLVVGARDYGWRSVVMNYRGTNGMELKTEVVYSAAYTHDFRKICQKIREDLPDAFLIGVGYSLGSNIMVKYACEEGDQTPLSAVISVSNPYDLIKSSVHIDKRNIYNYALTHGLRKMYSRNAEILLKAGIVLEHDVVLKVSRLREYDDHVTRKLFKYDSVDAYYEDASCVRYLDGLRIPVVFLSARDDPIIPEECLPIEECQKNKYTTLIITNRGGHVGFCEGVWPSGLCWADRAIVQIIEALRETITENSTEL